MEFLQELGFIGLFAGTFLAATVVPFSSDFLLIGMLVVGANPITSFVVATTGNWLGGLTSYYIGYLGKWEWIERWFGVTEEKLMRQKARISKYGTFLALMSWLPFIGDIFAIGLGFYKVNYIKSGLYMLVGKAIRFFFWVVLYYMLGDNLAEYQIF